MEKKEYEGLENEKKKDGWEDNVVVWELRVEKTKGTSCISSFFIKGMGI